jgi:hypothetical protein
MGNRWETDGYFSGNDCAKSQRIGRRVTGPAQTINACANRLRRVRWGGLFLGYDRVLLEELGMEVGAAFLALVFFHHNAVGFGVSVMTDAGDLP